jgi:tetratricopeptide (TPR) repeat protein
VGDREAQLIAPVIELASALEIAAPPSLRWWYRAMPGETHNSNPVATVAEALTTIFREWVPREGYLFTGDLGAVESHFAKASEAYGPPLIPAEGFVDGMGRLQLMLGRPQPAIDIFQRNVQLHPASASTYDSLADALEAAGRSSEALAQREEAVRRARAANDPRLETFTKRRDQLRKKVGNGPS